MQYDLVNKALIVSCNLFVKRNVIASARTVGTGGAGFSSEGVCAAHPSHEFDDLHRDLFWREKGKLIYCHP